MSNTIQLPTKALCVKNPFAGLIMAGQKKYEVRSYRTKPRGFLAICSSGKGATRLYDYYVDFEFGLKLHQAIFDHKIGETPNGFILGYAVLSDVKEFTGKGSQEKDALVQLGAAQKLYPKRKLYLWEMSDPLMIDPIPIKGKLGVFDLPEGILSTKNIPQ